MEAEKLLIIGNELSKEEANFNFQSTIASLRDLYGQSKANGGLGPQIDELLKKISSDSSKSEVNNLPISFQRILGSIGGSKYVGTGIFESIESIIRTNPYNIDNVVGLINQYLEERNDFLNKTKSLNSLLETFHIVISSSTELYDIGILIPNKGELTSIPNIEKNLHSWNTLLKQLAEITGEETTDIKIHKVSNGSIELYIQQAFHIIDCLTTMLGKIAGLYITINKIREHREALVKLNASKAEIKDIEKHEKERIDEEIDSTVKEIIGKYKESIPTGRENELGTAVNKGMRFIARSIENGIEVEIIPPLIEVNDTVSEGDDADVVKQKEEKNKKIKIKKEQAQIVKSTTDALKQISGIGGSTLKMLTGGDEPLDE